MLTFTPHDDVTEVRADIMVGRRSIYHVSAFLFDGTLFDSGPPRTGRALAQWAQTQTIQQIANTHHHEDHIGGNPFVPVPAFAPAWTVAYLANPPRIPLYRRLVWGQPRPGAATPLGETLSSAHHTLHVIPTPGQAHDHVAFWLPERGWLFSGDLFIATRARYIRPEDDLPAWLASLRRVLAYDFDTLFCAHAGRVTDAHAAIRRKIAFWEELGQQTRELAGQGYDEAAISRQLLGRDNFLTWWSRGNFSKRNLIHALLAGQA